MTERILIVEDEPDIRATLEYNLHRENYSTESVGTILEAEKILKETQEHLVAHQPPQTWLQKTWTIQTKLLRFSTEKLINMDSSQS